MTNLLTAQASIAYHRAMHEIKEDEVVASFGLVTNPFLLADILFD